MAPKIRHIVNLWSLVDYPTAKRPLSLERQIVAIKEAGFDGFTTRSTEQHRKLAEKHDLIIVGYFSSSKISDFPDLLRGQRDAGAHYINIQLGEHDTLTPAAVKMAVALFKAADKLGVEPSFETHRDTCTETPEKLYALAEEYKKATGRLLPFTWDFSHLAVVKHLHAGNYSERLLTHPDLIQRADQFHCRPFNGHHAQVPVTDGKGRLTPEVKDYLVFIEDLFRLWLKGKQDGREVFVVPEMGPVPGGYNLSTLPNSWEEAIRLRGLLDKVWKKALKG